MNTARILGVVHLPPAQAVQSIDGVLATIFKAADVPTLKLCREICSRWHLWTTHELRQQVTTRICFESTSWEWRFRDLQLTKISLGTAGKFGANPDEKVQVIRRTEGPFHPRPSPFTIPNLITAIRKNPGSFPCVSYEITTKLLGSEHIKYFLESVGSTIRRLKLVLHYFYDHYSSFQDTMVMRDLRKLLLFRTPYLEHLHLVAHLPQTLSSEILNLKVDATKNFLDDEESLDLEEQRPRSRRFLTLKSFTYEGLLPRQIVHDIIQTSGHLNQRRVTEKESAEEFTKRVDVKAMQPINPYYLRFLERMAGKYTGKIWSLTHVWFDDYFIENNSNAEIVQLYNEIMQSHSESLTHVEFVSCNFCDELRIPAMPNLRTLRLHDCRHPEGEIKLVVSSQGSEGKCKSTVCKVAMKFPKLELQFFPKEFNFGAHFALRLGVDPEGPFSSIKKVQLSEDCSWDVFESLCTQAAQLFPGAEVCIGKILNCSL